MCKIIVTEAAQNDLKETVTYIADKLKNQKAALNLLDLVEKEVASLSQMPERHPLVDDDFLKKDGFRFAVINSYLLFYIVRKKSKTVVIQRFLYARRNWLSILNNEKKQ